MKIGIVCYPTFGGSGVVATELGIELSKKGYEIHFITYNQPVKLELLSNKVHYHEVMVPDYPLFHYQPYELALSTKVVDMVKKHQKPTKENKGGIISKESLIHFSNIKSLETKKKETIKK